MAPKAFQRTVTALLLGVACTACNQPHPRWPPYAIGFSNATGTMIHDVHADWMIGNRLYRETAGVLAPGPGAAVNNGAADPIPPRATISWKSADAKDHAQSVEVASRIANITSFSGTIYFKITDHGVQVVPLTEEQMDRLAAEHKEYP